MFKFEKPDNLVELFEKTVAKYPNNLFLGSKNSSGTLDWQTYSNIGKRVDHLRAGLAKHGIKKGDAVGIIANNRVEWAIIAFATYGLGARFIPMYEAELPQTWTYIIKDSSIKLLIVSKSEIYSTVKKNTKTITKLKKIYVIESDAKNSLAELEKAGEKKPVKSKHPSPDDIATLIYTSGTTGNPKGVLLSHGNFTSNVHSGHKNFPELNDKTRSLSILPWAHVFGQTAELYNIISLGGSIGFMGSVATLVDDMTIISPTFLIAVPRVFNKVYDGLWAKMNEEGGIAKKLFVMGIKSGKKRRELAAIGKTSLSANLKLKIADKIVFQKIRDKFGGRLEGAMTGSATMNADIANFFVDIGIPTYDCYGLSETSPGVTMNCSAKNKPGTVGRPMEHVRVKIDTKYGDPQIGDGEIVVYGPNVMKGYHNKKKATQDVMTKDGGFRTGDRGRIDEDGFLNITGRIKEQYKLLNGKYVFPASIEEEIKLKPYILNAMVFGDGKEYNICLVVPDYETLHKHIKEANKNDDPKTTAKNETVIQAISKEIETALAKKYGKYEIPKKFIYLTEDFTLESGMLTQTMKLKRRAVIDKYKAQIEKLYK